MATASRPAARRGTPAPASATRRPAARRTPAPAAPEAVAPDVPRMPVEWWSIDRVVPYENNARLNQESVAYVANSIRQFGFLSPIIVDEEGRIIAGHTRREAAMSLHMPEVPVIQASHLTETQVKAMRLVDNKAGESSKWDEAKLAAEFAEIIGSGFDMGGYGWTPDQIDCLSEVAAADCLDTSTLMTQEQREEIRSMGRRAPQTTRIVIGEFVGFVDTARYRDWAGGLRELCDFSEERIVEELLRRLCILGQ